MSTGGWGLFLISSCGWLGPSLRLAWGLVASCRDMHGGWKNGSMIYHGATTSKVIGNKNMAPDCKKKETTYLICLFVFEATGHFAGGPTVCAYHFAASAFHRQFEQHISTNLAR